MVRDDVDQVERATEFVEGRRGLHRPARLHRDLDDHDSLGKFVRASWDALLVLRDYVRARREGACEQGVEQYLRNTPQGYRQMPVRRHAGSETNATMNAHGHERSFPVPRIVDETERHLMEAHIKVGRHGMVSPRLYYLDHWAKSGAIYVGYIGEHLTNTMSN